VVTIKVGEVGVVGVAVAAAGGVDLVPAVEPAAAGVGAGVTRARLRQHAANPAFRKDPLQFVCLMTLRCASRKSLHLRA